MVDMESILVSVKKLASLPEEIEDFSEDIILFINSTFSTLAQLGVGPAEGFKIYDESAKWSDYLQDNKLLEFVKEYTYLKVRLVFDTPTIGAVKEAMESRVRELEFRIPVAVDEINRLNAT